MSFLEEKKKRTNKIYSEYNKIDNTPIRLKADAINYTKRL